MTQKVAKIYEKYAPKNISLQKFRQMIKQDPSLLDDIGGKFSTFDPELAKLFKERGGKKNQSKLSKLLGIRKTNKSLDDAKWSKKLRKYD